MRLEECWHNIALNLPDTVKIEGAIVAHWLQTPVPLFNHVTGVNITEDETEAFIKKMVDHFSSKGLPFACFRLSPLTRPPSFGSILGRFGFEKKSEQSIMVFKGKPPRDRLAPDVKVKGIAEDEIDVFDRLMIASFEMPTEWKEVFDKLMPHWLRRGVKSYLAYVDGKPVGTVTLVSKAKTGCILNVGTLKEYRRRGIGTTLTVHALLESFKEGNDLHTLQTAKGGEAERLYQRIGFQTDHTVAFFVKNF
jgi:ribosomal protein S18 acetylase RimI-like enzyme